MTETAEAQMLATLERIDQKLHLLLMWLVDSQTETESVSDAEPDHWAILGESGLCVVCGMAHE